MPIHQSQSNISCGFGNACTRARTNSSSEKKWLVVKKHKSQDTAWFPRRHTQRGTHTASTMSPCRHITHTTDGCSSHHQSENVTLPYRRPHSAAAFSRHKHPPSRIASLPLDGSFYLIKLLSCFCPPRPSEPLLFLCKLEESHSSSPPCSHIPQFCQPSLSLWSASLKLQQTRCKSLRQWTVQAPGMSLAQSVETGLGDWRLTGSSPATDRRTGSSDGGWVVGVQPQQGEVEWTLSGLGWPA